MNKEIIHCERCKAPCKIGGARNPDAKMLRRSSEPKGLCINCAVQDFLRNTYPVNILLAQSGPQVLLYPHLREPFADIMRAGLADAKLDEIDWSRIVKNWDLPFPNKVKPGPMNPCSQRELDEIATRKRPGIGQMGIPKRDPLNGKTTITSFEECNLLEPGLGDKLRKCLREQNED